MLSNYTCHMTCFSMSIDKSMLDLGINCMNADALNEQINRLGLWSVIVVILSGVVAMVIPLDAPGGYTAVHADRVVWLSANREVFIAGWVNQIVAMFSLSAVFFCGAWHLADRNPLRAIIAALFVLMSVVAFIIPKFIAVWTIPLLADTITAGAVGATFADPLLRLLNVSVPFSLYTSFDYLGFWLYSVFALLAAGPLYGARYGASGNAKSGKIAAVVLGAFGVIYQAMLVALFLGAIAAVEIETYFLGASLLLMVHVVAMGFVFKKAMSSSS